MDNFEENLKRLEEIIKKLESGDVKLSESMKLFEEGVSLSSSLAKALDEAKTKITMLTSGEINND